MGKNFFGDTLILTANRREKGLKTLMDAQGLSDAIEKISRRAAGDMNIAGGSGFCVVGIKTKGELIARRMAEIMSSITGKPVSRGALDITLYRDDIGRGKRRREVKKTEMPFSVDGLKVLVVDDVIFTGRTARAAIEAVTDYGRPDRISLAVVADRGGREFPIQPDYCALEVKAEKNRKVVVRIGETDGAEGVFMEEVLPS